MRKNYYSLSTAGSGHSPWNSAGTFLLTLLYCCFVLGAAVTGSYQIYQWARWAVVDSYTISPTLAL
ncbi:MAG: hypothetical protein KDE19_06300, partial [Caldilineaceae bacterium]|nr:hypothetical protein [Caldilineaceae bacterium]